MKYKDINIGELIKIRVEELQIETSRICNFLNCTSKELDNFYKSKNINVDILLKWCKLLEYDFFRIYSHHLILYSPPSNNKTSQIKTQLPEFRKSLYTEEIIEFILEQITEEKMSAKQVIEKYKIPKTTLYKWMSKHNISK
ncbi:transposase [Empedobacter brevis]|uniref:transposase n=1 Tax=Empedobacter brevis TaxID=247 RepID=UPI00123CBFD9|nr:transposase [Empedobacter brevis]QES93948.1 transposase [Empedobacter brevis]